MCGIAGIVAIEASAPAPSRAALSRMVDVVGYRGPDEFGVYRDDRAGLAHARLSIIDLATGQQPMADATESHWIVFNGEVFNYVELREELRALGHEFRTTSDTEVVLQAYCAWGEAAFARMNGQWALAIWSPIQRRLVLSRDPMGICPLHYCIHGGLLHFASEVKSLFAGNPGIPRAFDAVGLLQTFTFWSVVPPRNVFEGVSELEPGHVRTYRDGTVTDRAFWAHTYPQRGSSGQGFKGTLDDAVHAVRHALERATALRMLRADVPVGSYLSGGLDSSLVAALGRQYAGNRFRTFSLRFDDSEYDETAFQRTMVERLQSDHEEVVVSRQDIAAVFPEVVLHAERPILRTAPAPMFLLSRLVRRHGIKVVLTGEGADEMFAGYDLFREGKVRRFWARQPGSAWRPRLLERLYPYLARSPVSQQAMARQFFGRDLAAHRAAGFAHGPRWQTTGALQRLFSTDLRQRCAGTDVVARLISAMPADFRGWTTLAQDQHVEIRTLLHGYLLSSQGDRMQLGNSVEGRFPFLDRDVVALADSLPAAYKLRALDEKHVVKRAAAGLVPESILARKKQPYRAPDALAFSGNSAPHYLDEVLSEQSLRQAGVFQPEPVLQLLGKCRSKGADARFSNTDNMAFVGILSTQLLYRQMIAGPAQGNPNLRFSTDVDRSGCTS
jgi:asparagine synthase (glutamine-hydrolysing)